VHQFIYVFAIMCVPDYGVDSADRSCSSIESYNE